MDLALAKQPNRAQDAGYGNGLLDTLDRIVGDVEHVQQQAEDARDLRLVLAATKQRSELVELRGKLTGAIESGSKVTINVHAPEPLEQTLADAQMLLELHGYRVERPAAPPQVIEGVAYQHPEWCRCAECHQENEHEQQQVLPPAGQ
jgi:hypothetical protein